MAFGIDDFLIAAASGLKLSKTLTDTFAANRPKRGNNRSDLELLLEEVRLTALQRLDEADTALTQFERLLREKGVDLEKTLTQVIGSTTWFQCHQAHCLKRFRRSFNTLADAAYESCDDIAALVRCRRETQLMGPSVVNSAASKHQFSSALLAAKSLKEAISLLREELDRQKKELT